MDTKPDVRDRGELPQPNTLRPAQTPWGRRLLLLAAVTGALWWPGVRVYYFLWAGTFGGRPSRNTNFSELQKLLPPETASLTFVYRGLPHQGWESGRLWRELFAVKHRGIGGYRFYENAIQLAPELKNKLNESLRDPELYRPFSGHKLCGGYHPDFAFVWPTERDETYALLCNGCHEMILLRNGSELHTDLSRTPAKALEELLKNTASR